MRRVHREPTRHLARWAGLALSIGLVAAACGKSGSATPTGPGSAPPSAAQASTAPSVAPSATPSKGPATAQFSLAGSAGLTGPMTTNKVFCGQPSLDGPQIEALGVAGTTGPDIVLFVTAGHIEARVGTGSAQTLKLRSFVGTGVTSFDAATGVQLDSTLTETTAPGAAIGTLGALTRITGTLDCGNEQRGTSNVVVTGMSALGQLSGALTEFRVLCTVTTSGTYVNVNGLSLAGSTPVLVFVTASASLLQVVLETKVVADGYSSKDQGLVTLAPGGARISGDVTETVKAGVTPHMLHVEGNDTCGTTINQ